jgi:hypothetical protein
MIKTVCFKGQYREKQKAAHRIGENNYKLYLIGDLYQESIKCTGSSTIQRHNPI